MLVMTIVGARPEFIQTAPVSKALRERHSEILVHTGQHYDANMSDIFFEELGIPAPEINLGVGSGGHGWQTGAIMSRLEPIMQELTPDWVLVYGDTNSTVAGALTAAKLNIPVAHVEAGLRSFDRTMPEEVNRVITDHISTLLFAPTELAIQNLLNEGIHQGVHWVGDVRVEVLLGLVERVRRRTEGLLASFHVPPETPFALATIHRASNTDDPDRLRQILASFAAIGIPVVLPVHPRLHKKLDDARLHLPNNVHAAVPLGFFDMVALIDACSVVITDSGGLQKEAYMLERPIVTVRNTTEWVETVSAGWNRLCEPEPEPFRQAVWQALHEKPLTHPNLYGTPGVSLRICDALEAALQPAPVSIPS